MAGNVNFVAATVGVLGMVGLILLLLVRKSRRKAKRKNSDADAIHVVENPNRRRVAASSPSRENSLEDLLSPEQLLYRYLHKRYWGERGKHCEDRLPGVITCKDFKQVCRVTRTSPPMLLIYSKKSVWELGLSDRVEQGYKEQFSFVMRGPESSSNEMQTIKMQYAVNDLIEFRQVHSL